MILPHSRNIQGKRSSASLSFWLPGITLCSMFVGLGTYIVIARTLGTRIFGTYVFVQWLATAAVPIIGVGTSRLTSRHIADIQSRETPRMAAGIFYFLWYRQCQSILVYTLAYLLLAYPLYWLFGICHPLLLLLASLSTLPLLLSSVVGITLRSQRRADLLTVLHLLGTFSVLLFILIASQLGNEHIGLFLLSSALAGTLTLIMAVICVTRLLPLRVALQPGIFLKERLLFKFKCSLLAFICDAIVWQRSELLLLAYWRKPDELGFYTISAMISTGVIEIAPQLFSFWIQPVLVQYFPHQRYRTPYDAFIKTSCYIALIAIPICVIITAFCPAVVLYTLGSDYLPLVQPLRILLISATIGSIATVSLTHLATLQQKKAQLQLGMGTACLNIMLALPFVFLWGMTGAALASASAQMVSALGSMLLCGRLLKKGAQAATR